MRECNYSVLARLARTGTKQGPPGSGAALLWGFQTAKGRFNESVLPSYCFAGSSRSVQAQVQVCDSVRGGARSTVSDKSGGA